MNKVKSSKATTKRLVASGIMLFGGLLTFTNKPQDVHAEDGAAPVKETKTTATKSSNVTVLKSSVKPTSESSSKVETTETDAEGVDQEAASEKTEATVVNDAEPTNEESTSNTTGEAASAKAAKAAETPEVAPEETPAPAGETSTSTDTQVLSKTITIDGKKYIFTGEASVNPVPLFKNKVTSVSNGTIYTYSSSGGTSTYYMRTTGNAFKILTPIETAMTTEKDENSVSKSFGVFGEEIKIKESISFTDDGEIVHTVKVTNAGAEAMNDVSFGLMLDTILGMDDGIDIFASGTGGAFFKNKYMTVQANGLENANVYAGKWQSVGDILKRVPATGDYGKNLYHGVDSAIQYETGKINLAPGESYTFKFSERIHIENQGKLTVRYVDTDGKTLRPNQVLEDIVGEKYSITTPTIKDYTFQSSSIPLTGKYTETDKTLTLVYRKNKLPDTQGQNTPAPTPKKKTPVKNTPAPTPVVTASSNKALPQTGEKSDSAVSAIGVGILATLMLFGLSKTKKHENN